MVIYLIFKVCSTSHLSICVLIYIKISLLIFMNNVVDVVGHLRLVNGQSLIDRPVFEEAEMISKRHSLVYLQSKEYVFTVIMITSSCTAKLTL